MQRISLVETHDTSAIEKLEAARDHRREIAAAAAGAAVRRTGLMKGGFGIGLAATGLGLGILLASQGVALLLNRPTPEEVATSMRDQALSIERLAAEKVQAAERETAEQLAATRAALDRATAAEQSAVEKTAAADRAAAEAKTITDKFKAGPAARGGAPTKTVVNFSIFRHREVDRLAVTTGWKYQQLTDAAPNRQWCYVTNTAVRDGFDLQIAVDGKAEPFNRERAARAGITQDDVHKALGQCDWFRGHNPNIREGGAPPS